MLHAFAQSIRKFPVHSHWGMRNYKMLFMLLLIMAEFGEQISAGQLLLEGRPYSPLNKQHLTAVFFVQTPWVMNCSVEHWMKGNKQACARGFLGLSANTFVFMANLMNFTFDVILENEMGEQDNVTGNWSGFIGALTDGRADVGVNTPFITYNRASAINFLPALSFDRLAALIKKPPPSVRFEIFLLPFSASAWFCLAACIPAIAFMATIITYFGEPNAYRTRQETANRMSTIVLYTVLAPIQKGNVVPHQHSFGFGICSWQAVTYILSCVYSTLLFTYLQQSFVVQESFQDFDQFIDVVMDQNYNVVMTKGIQQFLLSLTKGNEHEAKILNHTHLTILEDTRRDEFETFLMEDNTVVLDLRTVTDYFATVHCALYSLHFDVHGHYAGFPVSQSFNESSKLGFYSGLMYSYYASLDKQLELNHIYNNSCTDTGASLQQMVYNNVMSLTIRHLWPCFVVLAFGLILSMLTFVIVWCTHVYVRRGHVGQKGPS